jgi:hypothetical protein
METKTRRYPAGTHLRRLKPARRATIVVLRWVRNYAVCEELDRYNYRKLPALTLISQNNLHSKAFEVIYLTAGEVCVADAASSS